MSQGTRKCWIYRSSRKEEMYLYLRQKDGFGVVPAGLMSLMGSTELVMELDLHPGRRLARTCVSRVLADLEERGFHLQLPPTGPNAHPVPSSAGTATGRSPCPAPG